MVGVATGVSGAKIWVEPGGSRAAHGVSMADMGLTSAGRGAIVGTVGLPNVPKVMTGASEGMTGPHQAMTGLPGAMRRAPRTRTT